MKIVLKFIFAIVFLFSINIYSQTVSANATRPSVSDNAFLTAYGYTEVEFGLSTQKNFWSLPMFLKFSAIKNGEFGFLMNGLFNNMTIRNTPETKLGDPGIQFKYQFVNNSSVAFSAVGRLDFMSSNTKLTIYAVPSILTKSGQIDLTVGFSSVNSANSIFYAAAFSPKVDLPFCIYVELFGESWDGYKPFYFDAGISYPVSSDFILDVALVRGLNDDAADWQFQIGFTKTLLKLID